MPRCSTVNTDKLESPRTADLFIYFVTRCRTRKDSTKHLKATVTSHQKRFSKGLNIAGKNAVTKDSSPGVELGLENILCFCQFCGIRTLGLEIMGNDIGETWL